MNMTFTFSIGGEEHEVGVTARRPELMLSVDGVSHQVSEAVAPHDGCVLLTVDDRSYEVWRTWEGDRIHLRIGARSYSVGYEDAILAAQHHAGGDDILRADMPGVVVDVRCKNNAAVAAGDVVMVIESMKMQINIVAPRDGVVETIHLGINETFEKGAELVSMHAQD
jgi:acetyl/propionyl-CoA carboxylase alpha subunit